MNNNPHQSSPIVGLTVPAEVGMHVDDIATPALVIELNAFERNVATLRRFVEQTGVRLRAHAKTHKSADIARYQMEHGGACGMCCQKVAEAEALVAGGVHDVMVSNQVVDLQKIDRLAALASKARVQVCVDDLGNIADLSAAAVKHGTTLEVLVEIDCGANRCGVQSSDTALLLAQAIDSAQGLAFVGIQAYQGSAQHIYDYAERGAAIERAGAFTRETVGLLAQNGLKCETVGGAGTGSYYFESASGVYNELQCGSYVFMDADYAKVRDKSGAFISEFEHSLFILTS
ncbi:MAG: alanine racemase, partial [Pseudomonadota bacterium]